MDEGRSSFVPVSLVRGLPGGPSTASDLVLSWSPDHERYLTDRSPLIAINSRSPRFARDDEIDPAGLLPWASLGGSWLPP